MAEIAEEREQGGRWKELEEVVRGLRKRINSILQSRRIPHPDREDIVQKCLLAAVVKWRRIENPRAWIGVTLENMCITYWRKRLRLKELGLVSESEVTAAWRRSLEEGGEEVERPGQEMRWELERVIRRLPERYARALWLRYVAGCSTREISLVLGYEVESVRRIISRARRRLRRFLENDEAAAEVECLPPRALGPEWKRAALAMVRVDRAKSEPGQEG